MYGQRSRALDACAGLGTAAQPCCHTLAHSTQLKRGARIRAQALDAANAAVAGWEAGSVASRRAALDAAKVAAEFSQLCHKFMRSVHRT